MKLLGRILDALRTLAGTSESQVALRRIRREWLSLQLEVDLELEKVGALVARIAKRTKREADKLLEEPTHIEPPSVGGKMAIRQRIRARAGGAPLELPYLTAPSNGEQAHESES